MCASVQMCLVSILLFHTHIRCCFCSEYDNPCWMECDEFVCWCVYNRSMSDARLISTEYVEARGQYSLYIFAQIKKYISLPFIVGPKIISSTLKYDSVAICITLLASHCRRTFVFGLCSAQLCPCFSAPLIRFFFCTSLEIFLSKIVKCQIRQTAEHRRCFLWLDVFFFFFSSLHYWNRPIFFALLSFFYYLIGSKGWFFVEVFAQW